MKTWGAIFAVVAASIGGALGYAYLEMEDFQVVGGKSNMETRINKIQEGQAGIDARLVRLEIDFEHQQTAIDDLSKKVSDARKPTWLQQTLVVFCLNPSDRQKIEYCSQIGAEN